jgi:hypothetical protein
MDDFSREREMLVRQLEQLALLADAVALLLEAKASEGKPGTPDYTPAFLRVRSQLMKLILEENPNG